MIRVLALEPEIDDPATAGEPPPGRRAVLDDVATGVRVRPGLHHRDRVRAARAGGRDRRPARHGIARRRRAVGRRRPRATCRGCWSASGSWSPTPARCCSPAGCGDAARHPRSRCRPGRRGDAHRVGRRRARGAAGRARHRGRREGRTFSGGQRQRLVLARALAADPEVLVLVEPTSAVDAHTEARIADAAARRTVRGAPPWSPPRARSCSTGSTWSAFLRDGRLVADGLARGPAATSRRRTAPSSPARSSLPRSAESHERSLRDRRRGDPARSPTASRCCGYVRDLFRRHPRAMATMLTLHLLAAVAGLAGPRLLGELVQAVEHGHHDRPRGQGRSWCWRASWCCRRCSPGTRGSVSSSLGEQVLAELREDFVDNSLALPVGVVESAGSGDLLTRTSRDVEQLGWSVRWALPEWVIALITAVVTLVAAALVGWWVLLPCAARRAAAGDRAALVPRAGQGRLPARERVVLRDQRHAHRDRRGRPHGGGARARSGARRADRRRHRRAPTPPSATRSACAPGSSRPSRSPT